MIYDCCQCLIIQCLMIQCLMIVVMMPTAHCSQSSTLFYAHCHSITLHFTAHCSLSTTLFYAHTVTVHAHCPQLHQSDQSTRSYLAEDPASPKLYEVVPTDAPRRPRIACICLGGLFANCLFMHPPAFGGDPEGKVW